MPNALPSAEWCQPRWYVLFVRSNQERKVAESLSGRGVENFLPCCRSPRRWKDRSVNLASPLFPGYVFVHLPLVERMKALSVPNVVSLVGSGSTGATIADEEIAWIRRGIELGIAGPHPYLTIGQRVTITQGSLDGLEGILVRRQNHTRLVVAVTAIARAFVVNIEDSWVEPAISSLQTTSTVQRAWHSGVN
jgi:transcriptional antiterminator RfaH